MKSMVTCYIKKYILKVSETKVRLSVENILCANEFCVLIKSARRHAHKRTHAYARKKLLLRVNKRKLKQIQVHAHIYARTYACSIVYTCTQFAQMNGLTTSTRVYIINASNAMPKPYLYTYVCGRSRTVLANARMQTHANANKHTQTHHCDRRVGDFCLQTRLRFAH